MLAGTLHLRCLAPWEEVQLRPQALLLRQHLPLPRGHSVSAIQTSQPLPRGQPGIRPAGQGASGHTSDSEEVEPPSLVVSEAAKQAVTVCPQMARQ